MSDITSRNVTERVSSEVFGSLDDEAEEVSISRPRPARPEGLSLVQVMQRAQTLEKEREKERERVAEQEAASLREEHHQVLATQHTKESVPQRLDLRTALDTMQLTEEDIRMLDRLRRMRTASTSTPLGSNSQDENEEPVGFEH